MLELSCREIDTNRSWRLQFDIRSTTQTDLRRPRLGRASAKDLSTKRRSSLAAMRLCAYSANQRASSRETLMPELVQSLDNGQAPMADVGAAATLGNADGVRGRSAKVAGPRSPLAESWSATHCDPAMDLPSTTGASLKLGVQ